MTQDNDCGGFIVMLSVIMQNVIIPNFYSQIVPCSLIYEAFSGLFKMGHHGTHHTF